MALPCLGPQLCCLQLMPLLLSPLGGWVQGPFGCSHLRSAQLHRCCAKQQPPPQAPGRTARTWGVGVGSAAVPGLVVDEEGAAEGRQAPAEVGGQRGVRSHG